MMDNFITQYLNTQVQDILESEKYSNLSSEEKHSKQEELLNKLQNVILDTVVDNLTDAQVLELQDVDPQAPEMEEKLMEYSSTIPNLATILEEKINTFVASAIDQ